MQPLSRPLLRPWSCDASCGWLSLQETCTSHHIYRMSVFLIFWVLTSIHSRESPGWLTHFVTEAESDIRKDTILVDSLISMTSFVGNNGCFWNANTVTFVGRKRFRHYLLRSYIYLPARFSSAFSNFIATVAFSFFHSALFDERSPHVLVSKLTFLSLTFEQTS